MNDTGKKAAPLLHFVVHSQQDAGYRLKELGALVGRVLDVSFDYSERDLDEGTFLEGRSLGLWIELRIMRQAGQPMADCELAGTPSYKGFTDEERLAIEHLDISGYIAQLLTLRGAGTWRVDS